MLDLLVYATETALDTMEPASLTVSDDQWMFGLGDHRDPRVIDPTLSVLQAKSLRDGNIIATLVQWAFVFFFFKKINLFIFYLKKLKTNYKSIFCIGIIASRGSFFFLLFEHFISFHFFFLNIKNNISISR